jgi:hypothetical protein
MFREPKLPRTCHMLIRGATTMERRDIMPTNAPAHALTLICQLQLLLPPTRRANFVPVASNQNYARGRINHFVVLEAQGAPDVVLGMFFINATSTVVLFDSRPSHSFISGTYVGKQNMPIALLMCQMIVSSLGGDMPARQLCPKVNLKIRG